MNWSNIFKFLSGAFFVSAGILWYLFFANVSVPLLGTALVETPQVSGIRAIVHIILFTVCFYFGFLYKGRKQAALSFLKMAASGEVEEAYEKFVHRDFYHHNPYFASDRESLMRGMKENSKQFPDKVFESLRAVQDGNLVAVHGRVRLKSDSPWIALIHVFRFKGNRIIEEWEASLETPKESPNKEGLF